MRNQEKSAQFESVFHVINVLSQHISSDEFEAIALALLRALESRSLPSTDAHTRSSDAHLFTSFRERAVFALAAAALEDCPGIPGLSNQNSLHALRSLPRRALRLLASILPRGPRLFVTHLRARVASLIDAKKRDLLSVGNLTQNKYRHVGTIAILRPFPDSQCARPGDQAWPRIAIVVPSFNQGRYIAATLDSLLLQRYPNLVLHVQDGASTDHTIELLRHYHELYPDCFSYLSEPDRGQADAINRGFSRVEGDIMGWMNSDDIALPGSLFLIASELMCDPSIDVVYGDRLLISSDSRVVGRWCLPGHRDSDLFYAFWIPQETMFWRRSAWTISGQHVNTDLRFALDWDLVLRFLGAGCKFKHIPFYLGALRVYPEQKSQDLMESVGLREMDLVRLSNHLCQLVPRMCREHVQNVRGFHYRQKIASFWRLSSVYLLHSIGPRFAHRLGLSVVLLDVGSCQIAGRR